MTTKKIPQYGDPEILPRGTVTRPSAERLPFDRGGRRVESGPFAEGFLEAPDLEKLPQWRRTRGNEWTTLEFRSEVVSWLIAFFEARSWPREWDVREVATAVRSGRLPEAQWHLVIGVTPREGERVEVAVGFPPAAKTTPAGIQGVLAHAAAALDAAFAVQ